MPSIAVFQNDRIPVFGPVFCPLIALGFRRGGLAVILKANGANQKARQSNSGGLVLACVGESVGFYKGLVSLKGVYPRS